MAWSSVTRANDAERGSTRLWLALRLVGAGLLFATGAIHLDLYLTVYRTIPTIGWLFLLQVIAAFGLGVAMLIWSSRLVAAAGAGFAVATLGGYVLSLRVSLFGFREVRTTAGVVAGVIEVGAVAVLSAFALRPFSDRESSEQVTHGGLEDAIRPHIRAGRWAVATFSLLIVVVLGVSLAIGGPAPTGAQSSMPHLEVRQIQGVSVLTDQKGYTLYWFAPDTSKRSTCYGTCATYWPPVTGTPVAGPGVTGKLGTIERTGGGTQVTYDGHPLYTYIGDSAPGQSTGNDINLNGGFWYEMLASGRTNA
jgi:predicted lipoprotein with Yx(FWY)xxD motif